MSLYLNNFPFDLSDVLLNPALPAPALEQLQDGGAVVVPLQQVETAVVIFSKAVPVKRVEIYKSEQLSSFSLKLTL